MSIPYCPVLNPTLAEFSNFEDYISRIRTAGNHGGMVKVVAPPEWEPRQDHYKHLDLMVNHPVRQEVVGTTGIYELILISQRPMTLKQYQDYAEPSDKVTSNLNDEEVETMFWKNMRFGTPIYGSDSDIPSQFDLGVPWNLGELDTPLRRGLGAAALSGVITPYVYVGAWKTMFAWHCEDLDLPAINYLHFGKPKFWYAINPADAKRFEQMAISHFPSAYETCKEFLRHKCTLISPKLLRKNGIRITKAVQRPREFIIVFERTFHSGFNFGFNVAEAVNFALESWVEFGRKAGICRCESDNVRINIDEFEANLKKNAATKRLGEGKEKKVRKKAKMQ